MSSVNDNLSAGLINSLDILCTQEKLYSIPEYQRPYSWGKSNIEEFISDISDLLPTESLPKNEQELSGSINEYFIGTVIISKKDTHEIIDGQQRSITLSLIGKIIHEYFSNLSESKSKKIEEIKKLFPQYNLLYHKLLESRCFRADKKKAPIILKKDDIKAYEYTLNISKNLPDGHQQNTHVLRNFKYIEATLGGAAKEYPFGEHFFYYIFAWTLFYKVKAIIFEVRGKTAEDNTMLMNIFNVVNTRGLAVSDGTVLWNNLSGKIPQALLNDVQNIENHERFVEDCLMAYCTYDEEKRPKEKLIRLLEKKTIGRNAKIFKENLSKFLKSSHSFYEGYIHQIDDSEVGLLVKAIDELGNRDRLIRLVLYVLNYKEKLDVKHLKKLLQNGWYAHLSDSISLDGRRNYYVNYIKHVKNDEFPIENIEGFKQKEDILNLIENTEVYLNKNIQRSLMLTISGYYDKKDKGSYLKEVTKDMIDSFQIEHIAPQKPKDSDPISKLHYLGNLTIVYKKRNTKLRNHPFDKKRIEYRKSNVSITRDLSDEKTDIWSNTQVDARTKKLIQLLKDTLFSDQQPNKKTTARKNTTKATTARKNTTKATTARKNTTKATTARKSTTKK